MGGQNLNFIKSDSTGKTDIYDIASSLNDAYLGVIKWYSPWRRYTFYPKDDTLFDAGCLAEIEEFLSDLMEARKR